MCYSLWYNVPIAMPAGKAWKRQLPGYRPATSWVHYTTSCNTQTSAPEDGQDQRPKHVELIGIINKILLLHLVGVYIIGINDARSSKYQLFQQTLSAETKTVNKKYFRGLEIYMLEFLIIIKNERKVE